MPIFEVVITITGFGDLDYWPRISFRKYYRTMQVLF
jgi:hypothetical protein